MLSVSPSPRGLRPEGADSTTRLLSRSGAPRSSTMSPASRMEARRGPRSCPAGQIRRPVRFRFARTASVSAECLRLLSWTTSTRLPLADVACANRPLRRPRRWMGRALERAVPCSYCSHIVRYERATREAVEPDRHHPGVGDDPTSLGVALLAQHLSSRGSWSRVRRHDRQWLHSRQRRRSSKRY